MKQASDPLDISSLKKAHHRNYVNRFVTPFTAQPFALRESHFLIGSNAQPRAVSERGAVLSEVMRCSR